MATECVPPMKQINKWYNEVHIPMLMRGIKSHNKVDDGKGKGQYLAVYEYDSKEDMAALNASPDPKPP